MYAFDHFIISYYDSLMYDSYNTRISFVIYLCIEFSLVVYVLESKCADLQYWVGQK